MALTVTYIAHSCYAVQTSTALLVFDYWKERGEDCSMAAVERGETTPPEPEKLAQMPLHRIIAGRGDRQLYFIGSHFHQDHYNAEILTFPTARCLLSYDTVKRHRVPKTFPAVVLHPGDVYEDENLKLHAIHSTDVGISSLVTLPDGTTLYHAGDNNNWYFPEEEDQDNIHCSLMEMEGIYLATLREVRKVTQHVDHLFFPIDPRLGKEMLRGVFQWLWHIDTTWLYPMHCWERWDEVRTALDELKMQFPELGVVLLPDTGEKIQYQPADDEEVPLWYEGPSDEIKDGDIIRID